MPRVVVALIWGLVPFVGLSSLASAQSAPDHKTIVMFVDDRVLPLSRRLEQEIESLGIEVQVVPASSPAAVPADSAPPINAVAEIRLSPLGGDDVDMSIVDGAGKTVRYQLISSNPGEGAASELIATRAVELLRASLLVIANTPVPRRPEPVQAPPPKLEVPAPARAQAAGSSLSLSLGPAALYAARFRPGASLQAGLTWLPVAMFGVSASALVPVVTPRLEEPQGSVTLAANLFRLAGVVSLGNVDAPLGLRMSAGVELDDLRFQGVAVEPYRSAVAQRTSWSGFLGVTPRFRLASGMHVLAELAIALASSTSHVRLAGEDVAQFGRPFGTAALALELTWPKGQQ